MTPQKKDIISLLQTRKNGLNAIKIATKLNTDVRSVKPLLIEMQTDQKIVSGLKKHNGALNFFERVYYTSPKPR